MNRQKILIVDAADDWRAQIVECLTKEYFEIQTATTGEQALALFETWRPDLILTELLLPDIDGNQLCRRIRSVSALPLIVVSEKSDVFDKVLSLEIGADDYITKPFDCRELIARIHAVLRRYQYRDAAHDSASAASDAASAVSSKPGSKYVVYPDLIINLTNYSVIYMGNTIEMPPKELELLYFLASSPNQVFTREQLLDHIWGYEYIGDSRTVDVHIKRIREKIKDHEQWSLATVWGIGYKFESK